MKTEVISNITKDMEDSLTDYQLNKLKESLIINFEGVEFIIKTDELKHQEELDENKNMIDSFISSKQVEGCSERTIKCYKEIIEKDSNRDISNELFISHERYNEIKEKFGVPAEEDILMCMTDMKSSENPLLGHTALIDCDDEFVINQRVGIIRCDKDIRWPYIYTMTNLPFFINNIRSKAHSGVQGKFNYSWYM